MKKMSVEAYLSATQILMDMEKDYLARKEVYETAVAALAACCSDQLKRKKSDKSTPKSQSR